MDSFTGYLFATVTSKDQTKDPHSILQGSHTALTRLRRIGLPCEYIRVLEKHRSGVYHLHYLMQSRGHMWRYTMASADQRQRDSWYHLIHDYHRLRNAFADVGHAKFEIPRNSGASLSYILKYATKSSSRRVYRKVLKYGNEIPKVQTGSYNTNNKKKTTNANAKCDTCQKTHRLVAWSRNFDFKDLYKSVIVRKTCSDLASRAQRMGQGLYAH